MYTLEALESMIPTTKLSDKDLDKFLSDPNIYLYFNNKLGNRLNIYEREITNISSNINIQKLYRKFINNKLIRIVSIPDDVLVSDSYSMFKSDMRRYPILSDEQVKFYTSIYFNHMNNLEQLQINQIKSKKINDEDDVLIDSNGKRRSLSSYLTDYEKEAFNVIVTSNYRLVLYVVNKYNNSNISKNDLVQEGMLGLIRAAEKYDPNKNIKFSTYAVEWIRSTVNRYLYDKNLIKRPYRVTELLRNIDKIEDYINNSYDKDIIIKESYSKNIKYFEDMIDINNIKDILNKDYIKNMKLDKKTISNINNICNSNISNSEKIERISIILFKYDYDIHSKDVLDVINNHVLGTSLSYDEISRIFNISEDRVIEVMSLKDEPVRIDKPVGDEDDTNLGDFIKDDNTSVEDEAINENLMESIYEDIKNILKPDELFILLCRYFYGNISENIFKICASNCNTSRVNVLDNYNKYKSYFDEDKISYELIGKILKASGENVRQKEGRALRKIRRLSSNLSSISDNNTHEKVRRNARVNIYNNSFVKRGK